MRRCYWMTTQQLLKWWRALFFDLEKQGDIWYSIGSLWKIIWYITMSDTCFCRFKVFTVDFCYSFLFWCSCLILCGLASGSGQNSVEYMHFQGSWLPKLCSSTSSRRCHTMRQVSIGEPYKGSQNQEGSLLQYDKEASFLELCEAVSC